MSIHPALVLLAVFAAADGAHVDVAAGGRARGAGARRPGGPSRPSSVHDRDDGAAGKGSAGARHRRPPASTERRRRGSAGTGRSRRPMGLGSLAHAGVGGVRRRLCRRRRVRVVARSARRRATCCWCSPPARACPRTSARPSARSDSCAASGWTDRAAWRGSRTTPRRSSRRPICRSPPRCSAASALDHVSFAYPGTSRLVLDDVSLLLPAGSVVAIVGENGAGKTTLVKLLAKMYEPSSGSILVDDTPLARMPRRRVADAPGRRVPGFLPLRVPRPPHRRSRRRAAPRRSSRPWSRPSTAPAPDDVVARLPSGLETQLGPTWPGGVEVSFGQWQKLALARGFMRDRPLLLVLDEPTAALDAETEHALFERYAAAATERTAETAESRSSSRTGSRRFGWPT